MKTFKEFAKNKEVSEAKARGGFLPVDVYRVVKQSGSSGLVLETYFDEGAAKAIMASLKKQKGSTTNALRMPVEYTIEKEDYLVTEKEREELKKKGFVK